MDIIDKIEKVNEAKVDLSAISDYVNSQRDWLWHIERAKKLSSNRRERAQLELLMNDINKQLSKLLPKIKNANSLHDKLLKNLQSQASQRAHAPKGWI